MDRFSKALVVSCWAVLSGLVGCDCSDPEPCTGSECRTVDGGVDGVGGDSQTDMLAPDVPPVDAMAAFCEGSGPLLIAGAGLEDPCLGRLAERSFRFGICSCTDLRVTGGLRTDSFDSSRGPLMGDGETGGSVGTNGSLQSTVGIEVGGSLWVGGADFSTTSLSSIASELQLQGNHGGNAGSTVGQDAFVGGNVDVRTFTVQGTLTIPEESTLNVSSPYYRELVRAPVSIEPPCACEPEDIPDLLGIITAHETVNNNADIELGVDDLIQGSASRTVTLPCGRFFVSALHDATIVVEGRVALFVMGDSTGGLDVQVMDGAEIDMFVGGNVTSTSGLRLGSAEQPAAARLYVAGDSVTMTSASFFSGNVYVPNGEFRTTGGFELFGSIFARSIQSTGEMVVHYDTNILRAGEECMPPEGCTTCGDCPSTQACIEGACGACRENADCCAPLTCQAGVCQPLLF